MYTPPLHPTRCVPFRFRVPLVAFHPRSPASTHVSLSVPPFCYRYKDKVHRSFDKARNVLPPAGCAALFFSWGKTLPGISTTSTSPPFFSYLFFSCFSPFFRTRFIIISISSLHLLSPSFLFVRWSFPFGERIRFFWSIRIYVREVSLLRDMLWIFTWKSDPARREQNLYYILWIFFQVESGDTLYVHGSVLK